MVKRSELARGAPLTAKGNKPLRRTPLAASKPLTTARELAQGQKKPRPPRNTGPSAFTRLVVIGRAGGCCERCGKTVHADGRFVDEYSIHHRKPRGMGGTKDPAANSPSNLVLLCGSATTPDGCHTSVEKFREASVRTGWIVPRTADPAKVPVKFASGRWYLLNDEGTLTETVRPEPLEP